MIAKRRAKPLRKIDPLAATIIPAMAESVAHELTDAAPAAQRVDWQAELARHGRWLRTVVSARISEADGVEDVMQAVSLAAIRQAAPLKDAAKAAPWLYQLAIRQCLLYRRRCGRQRKLTDGYAQAVRPTEYDHRTPDPLTWLLADERRGLIRTAMRQLHRRDAEILLLKYTEEWSYHDIAKHLGISHSAVEARLHRARGRLRQQLAAMEVVDASV